MGLSPYSPGPILGPIDYPGPNLGATDLGPTYRALYPGLPWPTLRANLEPYPGLVPFAPTLPPS